VLRRIGADRLLVPVTSAPELENCVFPLNETGAFIWERLSQGQSLAATARSLAETFAVSPEGALADCREFAAELVAHSLLEETGA
jgi:hypothetical protein